MDDDKTTNDEVVEEVVDQPQDDAQEVQQEVQEEEQVEDESEAPAEVEEPQEEERPPSRREQLRINQLLRKYGPPQERQAPAQEETVDYRSMIEADDEVYDQLGQATKEYGTRQYQQGLEEANALKFQIRLESDAPKVEAKYPQLDKNSDEFNPAIASALNDMFLSSVGYDAQTGRVNNPNIRYSDYIDAMFELVDEASSRKVQESRTNIAKQASRTGLRPDGSSVKRLDLSKAPQDMTDEELDAMIAKSGLAPKKR